MKSAKPSKPKPNKFPITVSNPDKVFWPDEGYTKLDLIQFYAGVFPKLSPYVKDRILTMERCPDGMEGQCFYQKEAPNGLPPGTPTKAITHSGKNGKTTNYVVGGSLATQLALTNLGCIPVHVMGGRAQSPRTPDWVCFDLDPQTGKFAPAARAALQVKEILDLLHLTSFCKTSGGRGLHVFVPLQPKHDVDLVLDFAEKVAGHLSAASPKDLTTEHSIAARGNRVYLDPFRNGFGQTVVAPYSVRRRPGAPVSTPLDWSEVKPGLDPADFNIGNFSRRLKRSDPWKDFFRRRQSLDRAMKALEAL
jgi:bifunctional non-homologous end joining protein LigD